MGKNARNRYETLFKPELVGKNYMNLYNKISEQ